MSTKSIALNPNGNVTTTTTLHRQFKQYLLETFGLDDESIDVIDEIVVRLVTLAQRINLLKRQRDEYESKPLCNGVPCWPKDNEGYLKCNHSVGKECPMHGRPRNKQGRLRIGVGRGHVEIDRVMTAMDNYSTLQGILRELEEKENALRSMQDKLMNSIGIYRW